MIDSDISVNVFVIFTHVKKYGIYVIHHMHCSYIMTEYDVPYPTLPYLPYPNYPTYPAYLPTYLSIEPNQPTE